MGRFTAGGRSLSKQELYRSHYNSARANLLIAVVFTLINCVLIFVGGSTYFLFSCSFPYAMAFEGAFWTWRGLSPEEYAELGWTQADMLPDAFLYIMLAIAAVAVGLYVLCWFLSKKRVGWMIAAASLFVVDTMFLILYYDVQIDFLLDYLFHAWVLFILIRGIISFYRAKQLEKEEALIGEESFVPFGTVEGAEPEAQAAEQDSAEQETAEQETAEQETAEQETAEQETAEQEAGQAADAKDSPEQASEKKDSPVLHMADYSVKNRILLIMQVDDLEICYRRVGKVNELVVNSMVYDLLDTGHVETAHELSAVVKGREIAVGTDAASHMYICVDGEVVKRKLRLV